MALFIKVVAGDLRDVFSKALGVALLLFSAFYGPSGITLGGNGATLLPFASFLATSFLFFFVLV